MSVASSTARQRGGEKLPASKSMGGIGDAGWGISNVWGDRGGGSSLHQAHMVRE